MSERLSSRASCVLAPWQARSVHGQHVLLGGGRAIKMAKGAVWGRPRQAASPCTQVHGCTGVAPLTMGKGSPGRGPRPSKARALTGTSVHTGTLLSPVPPWNPQRAGGGWWIQTEQGFLVMLITLGFTLLQATGPGWAPGLGLAMLEAEGDGAVVLGQSFGGEEGQQRKGARGEDWQAVWGGRRGCLKPLLGAARWACCPAAAREGWVRAEGGGAPGREAQPWNPGIPEAQVGLPAWSGAW